jgi:photosystem II stability/assembly factor-like uncharacterized protein
VIYKTTEVFSAIQFVTPTRGWMAGFAGRIERTDDGGLSWKNQRFEREGDVLNSICFIDAERGFVAGGRGGGSSWTEKKSETTKALLGLAVSSADISIAVGEGGTILRSEKGSEWAPINSGTVEMLNAVAAADDNNFCAVGSRGATLQSTDGGKSWTVAAPVSAKHLLAIDLISASQGVAVGRRGGIQKLE